MIVKEWLDDDERPGATDLHGYTCSCVLCQLRGAAESAGMEAAGLMVVIDTQSELGYLDDLTEWRVRTAVDKASYAAHLANELLAQS